MGSWSVYCSLSSITITAGTPCVLLPLTPWRNGEYKPEHAALTLPIFGEYDDYGGIENIVTDWNTALIEKTYGISIEHFCALMLQNGSDYLDGRCGNETIPDKKRTKQVVKLVEQPHMWIRRDVYDFMIQPMANSYDRIGSFEMGSSPVLERMGFIRVEENSDKRYHQTWQCGDITVHSDGRWMHLIDPITGNQSTEHSLYTLDDVKKYVPAAKTDWFDGKESQHLYELWDVPKRQQELNWVLGYDRYHFDRVTSLVRKLGLKVDKPKTKKQLAATAQSYADGIKKLHPDKDPKLAFRSMLKVLTESERGRQLNPMQSAYEAEFGNDDFCKGLADLITMRKTMRAYSQAWEPFVEYRTPQSGEFDVHQKVLDAFASINRSVLTEYEDDE